MNRWIILLVIFLLGCEGKIPRLTGEGYCDSCLVGFTLLDYLLEQNVTQQDVEVELIKACTAFNEPQIDFNVCNGAVRSFAPEVWPIIVYLGVEPQPICEYLGFCSKSKFRNTSFKEPKTLEHKEMKMKDDGFYILQLSDIHFDEFYTVGANPDCGEPLCCRSWNTPGKRKAQKWGDYSCDLTLPMFEAMLQNIANLSPQPDILVVTGDNTAHDIWNETRSLQMSRLATVSTLLEKYVPNIPVFPIMGNHDTFPVDQFNRKPTDSIHYDDFTWLLNHLAAIWGKWLPEDAQETLAMGGYYSVLVKPGFRVIGITTQWGDSLNFYLLLEENQQQPQFDWLSDTLTQAEKNGEKVIILGHIPVGDSVSGEFTSYAQSYISLVNKFQNIIVGQFYGHSHDDEFEIVVDGKGNPTGILWIAPSVTTYTNHNPSYRIYEYDNSFVLQDYHQFITNLTLANIVNKPTWFLEYSAKSEYSLKDMSPASWLDLVNRFQQDDTLFQKWYHYKYTSTSDDTCTGDCKKGNICEMLNANPDGCNSK